MLIGLASHYYRPDFTPMQVQAMMRDYLQDLADYSVAQVEVAIGQYRRDASEKFYPKSGQLIALIEDARRNARIDTSQHTGPARLEFGDPRPYGWEYKPQRFWQAHWKVGDLDHARDPERRARYDAWIARKESSDAC